MVGILRLEVEKEGNYEEEEENQRAKAQRCSTAHTLVKIVQLNQAE